jgi:hypothetical protein
MISKKAFAVVAVAVAAVAGSTAAASANDVHQDDLAPHSTAPVVQTGVANINGDTTVTGVGDLLVPVNAVVAGKSGPQQTGNEASAPQFDNDTAAGHDVLQGLL